VIANERKRYKTKYVENKLLMRAKYWNINNLCGAQIFYRLTSSSKCPLNSMASSGAF
jgi:hypothetical protein